MKLKRKHSYSRKHTWFAFSVIYLGMSTLLLIFIISGRNCKNAKFWLEQLYKSKQQAKPIFEQSWSGFSSIAQGTEETDEGTKSFMTNLEPADRQRNSSASDVDDLVSDKEEQEDSVDGERHFDDVRLRDAEPKADKYFQEIKARRNWQETRKISSKNSSSAARRISHMVDKLKITSIESQLSREKYKSHAVEQSCDLSVGKWVHDESYPFYSSSCAFIDEAFRCQDNGRLDEDYMKWRWQPANCDIPRFNATDMLLRLSGKRVVFIGDSIARNQWESLVCMLAEPIPDKKTIYELHGRSITKQGGAYAFNFENYNLTIEFYRSHFLVQEGRKPPGSPKKVLSSLIVDKMDKTVSRWRGADVLVFNTGHWWNHGKLKRGRCYFQEGDVMVLPNMDIRTAYQKAIRSWGDWIDRNINPTSSHVFFRSYSPAHFRGGQWNSGGKCHKESEPILDESFTIEYPVERMHIVEKVIQKMKVPATFLNITILSGYRKDGHPSIWRRRNSTTVLSTSALRHQDCSHWCLPGVPDTWNHLLYAALVQKGLAI